MKKLLLILLLFIGTNTYSQNQFADYVNYLQDSALNKFIKEWIGVPYKLGGTTKRGIDCSKLTQRLFKDVYNKTIPDVSWKQWNASKRVKRSELQLGDLVFFRSRRSPSGWHVGFYLGNNKFLQAPQKGDRVKISSLNEYPYNKSYKGAGRF